MYLYYQRFQTDREHITSNLNGTKTVRHFCKKQRAQKCRPTLVRLMWALGAIGIICVIRIKVHVIVNLYNLRLRLKLLMFANVIAVFV
jgi:hypothetical protein